MMARMGTMRKRAAVVALGAVLLASASGCQLRRETSPPVTPTATQYDVLRNEAAQREAAVLDALAVTTGAQTPGQEFLIQAETAFATPHLDALGGVYVPFPSASPTASVTPSPTLPQPPSAVVIAAAHARDEDLSDALIAEDPELALLLASIGLSHAEALGVGAYQDVIASGDAPLAEERPAPGAAFADLVPASTALDEDTLEGIIVAHDYAAYVYEVIAARTKGDARTQALARSRIHEKRADDLVALATTDPRSPAYVVDRDQFEDADAMDALARETEAGIADRYIATFAIAARLGDAGLADRAWLISGAYDSLVQGLLWPGASVDDAIALPGVVLPGN